MVLCKSSSSGGESSSSTLQNANRWLADNVRIVLYKHGQRVGRRPWLYLLSPLVLTVLCSLGAVRFKADQEVRQLFTPSDAPSHDEFAALQHYFDDPGGLYDLTVFVRARDGGSLMRPGYPQRVIDLINFLEFNSSILDPATGHNLTFAGDLRINHVDQNRPLLTLLRLMAHPSKRYPLKYPVMTYSVQDFYIGHMISTVVTDPVTQVVTEVRTVVAHFRSACGSRQHFELIKQWTYRFLQPQSLYEDQLLVFSPWNDYLMTKELTRVSLVIVPYVALSFAVLILFAMASSINDKSATSKPWEALAGVLAVALAVASSFGVIFLLGFSFVGTLAVMPVLVLAMGLDVTFIVLRNWHSTNPEFDTPSRLAETWAESGTSVIITSLTNVLSTAVGTLTTTPAIQIFCLSTTIAVIFLFFYQITFFAAVIALGGQREERGYNAFLVCMKSKAISTAQVAQQPPRPKRKLEAQASLENRNKSRFPHTSSLPEVPRRSSIFAILKSSTAGQSSKMISVRILNDDWWHKVSIRIADVLCNNYCRVVVTLLLVVYWIVSVWGCMHLQLGLTPEKLFLPDSPVLTAVEVDKANLVLDVFVQNPPNFTNQSDSKLFYSMVRELEEIPESLGHQSTNLWLRPYEDYVRFMFDGDSEEEQRDYSKFYQFLPEFLDLADNARWRPFVSIDRDSKTGQTKVVKFFFTVAYKRHRSWTQRVYYTRTFRQVLAKYDHRFNVSLYCEDNNNFVVDQLEAIPANTLQDVLITALCMSVICLLFIPNTFNTVCAMLTIFSINLGVFGMLVHWDVALDPVSMTSLLMSIGYSVDFTSHISYHYYVSAGADQRQKLITAVSSIGLPMIETGFSTILSVGCLCLVQSYLVWVYFKTTLLVVLLGLFHGLIVLPTFLAWLSMDVWDWIYKSNSSRSGGGTNASPTPDDGGRRQKTAAAANRAGAKIQSPDIVQIAMGEVNN